MWIVILIVLVMAIGMTRRRDVIPGRLQNAAELAYESLENFALSLGGEAARPYVPWFAGLFIFIVVGNWIGLVSPVGKIEELRAPTSDLNITIGLALLSFAVFEVGGLPASSASAATSASSSRSTSSGTASAPGIIALFVGLIELLLEFIKPVTLSMRLFGNIYGGEVALGVVTGLTIAIVPVAAVRAGVAAQPGPGAHLQRPVAHVHPDRRSRATSTRRATSPPRRSTPAATCRRTPMQPSPSGA